MAPGLTTARRRPALLAFWSTTIGKKQVMAVTGLLLVLFLLAHMAGNLKIFFGPEEFDDYSGWLRTIGEPVLHSSWYLWVQRSVLLLALVLHVTAAVQLSTRDRRARPVKYAHGQRPRASFATHTMRWGGATLAVYVLWHILDLTVGVANQDFRAGHPYHNVVADFQVWWVNLIYLVALLMLGLHINHGFWSAAQTLGITSATRDRALRATGTVLAVVITGGFMIVPIAVMAGWVA
ncbi:succinate dehydrogenase cytochrome b subunit [Amycolatopsis jiangsuensis]|uniref:Succinate dehydrogenase / fumarate reductase cytochrome b subunit n=1 Tax=Amycolatopsis jiangsuensis TaxID=1181879 RepID=A0A840IPN3_9PSEU|nr:succinate dehydrogenase cytochrome b subunit [Amycolatopsis jiangsuensis]MBB4683415.1 succinate dehydrogenase / fumarate reductase cytochrome b subunit [Amycolatopsis jiangsuensis]